MGSFGEVKRRTCGKTDQIREGNEIGIEGSIWMGIASVRATYLCILQPGRSKSHEGFFEEAGKFLRSGRARRELGDPVLRQGSLDQCRDIG